MNNLGRGNFVLMFLFLSIGMMMIVGALEWVGSDVIYHINEEVSYYHNLSANVTNFDSDITFVFDEQPINWTNASGTYAVDASDVSDWIYIYDSVSGNLTINATHNNQTGFFVIPIQANNASGDDVVTDFEFQINATNDYPNFTNIENEYNLSQDEDFLEFLNGTDEENHYPLYFNVSFISNNCTHATWSGMNDNENCSLFDFGFNSSSSSNTSALLNFTPNSTHVGTYWANISVIDYNSGCPHAYCDNSTYEQNLTTYYSTLVKFNVFSRLQLNVSNCTNQSLTEGDWLNCTIDVITIGETDNVSFSSLAFFRNDSSSPHNSSWFKGAEYRVAENFAISINISILLDKEEVGNWTVNFSADDGDPEETPRPVIEPIYIFVNYTESNVSLDAISDLTEVYQNKSFTVNAYDEDLLILDGSIKDEQLTYASNTSWVSVTSPTSNHLTNYTTSTVSIDYDNISASGNANYSVLINVTDAYGNSANQNFIVEILNDTAPEWNSSLADPVSLSLVEDEAFIYNVSVNVSDEENDPIIFYYQDLSSDLCSLNSSTFNSTSGMINFTPQDCDVGYHNVTIIASDSKLNSSYQFNFTVSNIADVPTIYSITGRNTTNQFTLTENFTFIIPEGVASNFTLVIDDDDFMIPSGQRTNFYNESLTINVTSTNSTGGDVDLFEFSFLEFNTIGDDYLIEYNATFTPNISHVDNYTIFVNITDNAGNFTNRTFYLNITEDLNAPNLTAIDNQSVTINDYVNFTVNATDDEDDYSGLNLSYSIANLSTGSPNLTIGNETGRIEFDMNSNESYSGIWDYNVTVTDSDGMIDSQVFYLYTYGTSSLVSPAESSAFNLTETVAGTLNFTINHSVGDNLTYEFWIDSIACGFQNSSNCTYGNLTQREIDSSYGNGSAFNWSFTSNYTDETYGKYKNLTVSVYPNSTELNSTQRASIATNFSFKLNISHTNSPPEIHESIGSHSGTYGSNPISINLLNNIRDYDYLDSYYLQNVTFTVSTSAASTGITAEGTSLSDALNWTGLISDWSLQLYATAALEESLTIMADDSSANVTTSPFTVTFTEPSVTVVPTPSSGGTTTKLKFYSLKVVVPQDVIISDQDYIDVPFSLQNVGTVDLSGIDLSSQVLYNNDFSDDVKISLGTNFVPSLKIGETQDYVMRILADTDRSGRYKATIFANISSPKFSDWGDFFIELQRTNETEIENILIFTEKLIAENPECLELTELFRRAQDAFYSGDSSTALDLAQQVSDACEDSILANEQVRYSIEGFVQDNFYYISFATLVIFFVGFIFYVYKRVRFNKSEVDEYV